MSKKPPLPFINSDFIFPVAWYDSSTTSFLISLPYQVDALETLVKLSESAAPFLSSREIYDVVEKNRAMVISEKTGKPVTDAEIRDGDFNSDSGFVRTDESKVISFDSAMSIYFSKKETERNELALKLRGGFSSSKLHKLFEEGSAREAMDELGLSEKKAKPDPDLARMHYCMRSIYEENAASSIAEMIIAFTFIKAVTPAQISALAAATKGGRIGLNSAAMLAASGPQVIKACERVKARDQQIVEKGPVQPHVLVGLPKEFDFDILHLQSLPMSSIKSCQRLGMEQFYIKQQDEMSCAMTLALSLIP